MFDEPKFHFWKVGTGDSTSIVIKEDVVLQVDLNDNASDDNDNVAIVDTLVEELPEKDGNPYLSGFALTHPDQDHIKGFKDLLDQVTIGELWFTPGVFNEYKKDLCEDAVVFQDEAMRRVKLAIEKGAELDSGERIRIVGYDDLLETDEFKGFPTELLSGAGQAVTELDGEDLDGEFRAFIHAPFNDDEEHDRNDTSLAMQVVLGDDPSKGGALLFGDISYPVIRRIFDETKAHENEESLAWKVFLAPHHCSKSVMYQREDGTEVRKQDILDDLDDAQVGEGYIVSSSERVPTSNKKGDNPPHAIAKDRYEEVAGGDFLCTGEDSGKASGLTFTSSDGDIEFDGESEQSAEAVDKVGAAVIAGRGSDEPPTDDVGFGH
ncbi:hypothetical protein GN278_01250 [Rhodobacteraceae bacterium Araon29]